MCTGAEKRLHKNWAAVTTARTTVAGVAYDEGLVAIHPLVVLALSFSVTAWGGSSASYHPVSIGAWDQGDRRAFGDMLEALSQYDGGTDDWLARYRDAMGAVEEHRRQGQESADMARAQAIMQEAERHPQQPPSHDQATWDKTKRERAWYAMVKERNILMQASLTTEAATILRLKRTVPFSAISRIWDSRTQRVVSGAELKDAVRHEASLRHPPVPNPVPAAWVDRHIGTTTWETTAHTKIQQACRLQAIRESEGQIKQGVGYPVKIGEVIQSATDQTSATATIDWYAPVFAGHMGPITSRCNAGV